MPPVVRSPDAPTDARGPAVVTKDDATDKAVNNGVQIMCPRVRTPLCDGG